MNDDELGEILRRSMEEHERLGPSVIPDDAPWSYHAIRGEPAIACRTHDRAGRRVTCFIQLSVSSMRDGVKDAAMIAAVLNPSNENEHTREATQRAKDRSMDRNGNLGTDGEP